MDDAPLEIRHNPSESRFEASVGGAEDTRAVLVYRPVGDQVLDYASTRVPPAARGKGIAGKLVRYALDWARAEGYRIIPSCSYVEAWLARHPDYQDLVARD